MHKYFFPIVFLFFAFPLALLADSRGKVPSTVDIQIEIRKDQDSLAQQYRRYFRNYSNAILQGLRASNAAKRAVIAPLYQKVFNIDIPSGGPESVVPADELKNLTDGKLYAEAWLPLIANASLESSGYYNEHLKPILADPRTDRGAVLRIQKDAGTEWENYKAYSAQEFAGEAVKIKTDFEAKLPSIAREHSELRAALVSIVGPIPPDEFDSNFQKYIALAQSKMQPVGAATTAVAAQSPVPAEPADSKTGQQPSPKATPVQTPVATDAGNSLDARVDDLASKLKQQKQSLDTVKAQAQSLDDNYPILHHELSSEIEKLSSEIFWMRLILVLVGAGVLVGIGISLLALDRIGDPLAKKSKLKGRREPRTLREEPLKAILGRIYKMEEEISQLRGELQDGEEFTSGNQSSEEDV